MLRLCIIIILSAAATVSQAASQVRVIGSTTVLPIAAEAAKVFRALHPDITLTIAGGGSGVGIASIRNGSSDIGMASRALTPEEQQSLGQDAELVPVARDAVAIAVSSAVYEAGVHSLSLAEIADIYRGNIKNWRPLGGPDASILVIDKETSRGTRHVFAQAVLGKATARAPGASIIVGSNNEEQAVIAQSQQAIGMLSHAWLNDRVRGIAIRSDKELIEPTVKQVTSGRYPLQRTLNILLTKNASPDAQAFRDFLLSEQGQAIVQRMGYLPIK